VCWKVPDPEGERGVGVWGKRGKQKDKKMKLIVKKG